MNAQKYIPRLLKIVQSCGVDPSYLLTHPMRLEDAPKGYELFKNKEDNFMCAAFMPSTNTKTVKAITAMRLHQNYPVV